MSTRRRYEGQWWRLPTRLWADPQQSLIEWQPGVESLAAFVARRAEARDDVRAFAMRAPFQAHSPESIAAADEIAPSAASLRGQVYALLRAKGPLTDEEIQELLHLGGSTERPRRVELVEMGLVIRDGVGTTRSGRSAAKWRAIIPEAPIPDLE